MSGNTVDSGLTRSMVNLFVCSVGFYRLVQKCLGFDGRVFPVQSVGGHVLRCCLPRIKDFLNG